MREGGVGNPGLGLTLAGDEPMRVSRNEQPHDAQAPLSAEGDQDIWRSADRGREPAQAPARTA